MQTPLLLFPAIWRSSPWIVVPATLIPLTLISLVLLPLNKGWLIGLLHALKLKRGEIALVLNGARVEVVEIEG